MAIEIVDLPINSMVVFHSFLLVYQRVTPKKNTEVAVQGLPQWWWKNHGKNAQHRPNTSPHAVWKGHFTRKILLKKYFKLWEATFQHPNLDSYSKKNKKKDV